MDDATFNLRTLDSHSCHCDASCSSSSGLPVDLELEAVVLGGEDEHVVDGRLRLLDELSPTLDEANSLHPPLELHLVLTTLAQVHDHLHRWSILLELVLAYEELLHLRRHGEDEEVLALHLDKEG